MNIDGTNPRLVSGEWDRSPQNMQWKADGTGVYFTAQDQGSQNLYLLPLAGIARDVVQPVTQGHAHAHHVEHREGQGRRRARPRRRRRPTSSLTTSRTPSR